MQTEKVWTLDEVKADWARVKCEVAYVRTIVAAHQLMKTFRRQEELKRLAADSLKFRPDQPRIPSGQSGGGQWTDGGGGGQVLSDATPDNFWKPGSQLANNAGGDGSKAPGIGHNQPKEPPSDPLPPPETPPEPSLPEIPETRPEDTRVRNGVIKEVAKYLAKNAGKALGTLAIAAGWLWEAYPYIHSYLDAPRSLDELHAAVSQPEAGYDIHHIVEQTPAEKEGYSRVLIDGRENLVRVPTLKHWEITRWYATRNEAFGMQSPRDYLRGKSWNEKQRIGHQALKSHGVLKP
jgi:hypothetical protein